MTTFHSMASTATRKIVWAAVLLLPLAVVACGGSTQGNPGTAPSLVSPLAGATEGTGSFNLLKEGRGKGGHSPAPEIGTTPMIDPDDPEIEDGDESGHGHGNASIQYEGFIDPALIEGDCNGGLKIPINDVIITTVGATEFQRATCEELLDSTATRIHLHIAAKWHDETLVATYVRMQGPKGDHGDDTEEEEGTTPE
jgi:hypothetical protein